MALTKVTRTLLSTGIDDQSNATAITIDSSENVGIGTSSPARKVQIQDTSSTVYLSLVGPTNAGAGIMFGDSDDETVGRVTYDNSVNNMQFWTNDSEKMRIDSSGNVGIGTSSPLSKLDVAGNIRISDGVIEFDKPSVYGFRFLQNDAGNDLSIQQGDANNANYVTRLNIGSTGKVGIGTTSPARALEVHSSSSPVLESVASSTNNSSLRLRGSLSATHYWDVQHVHGDNDLTFGWSGGEKVRITDTGNVKIKTTSDYYANDLIVSCADDGGITLVGATTDLQYLMFADGTSGDARYRGYIEYGHSADHMAFATAATERMRINSSGNLLVGTTDGTDGVTIHGQYATQGLITISTTDAGGGDLMYFKSEGNVDGSITTNGSSTSFNTSSDGRLKDITGKARGLEVINELNPVAYNWKADGQADEGLIAQEVLDIVPNAVTGSEEEQYYMDYSKLVVHLVKAVKELSTEVDELKKQLENK